MLIQGKIIYVLPERGGTSQRTGTEWKLAQYVLETFEQFPKKICFEVFGVDRIQQFNIQAGQSLSIDIDIDAHEYQGRWYNTIRAWRVAPYDPNTAVVSDPAAAPIPASAPAAAAQPAQQPQAPFPPTQPGSQPEASSMGGGDDLPF